jgi:hypothetical protein
MTDEMLDLIKGVVRDGHFYVMGRKVILVFEDTGKPTNEDEEVRELYGLRDAKS